jgi:hypothetical protein
VGAPTSALFVLVMVELKIPASISDNIKRGMCLVSPRSLPPMPSHRAACARALVHERPESAFRPPEGDVSLVWARRHGPPGVSSAR